MEEVTPRQGKRKFNDEENNIINTHTIQQANSAQSISSMELLSNAVPFKSAPTPYTVRNIDTNTNAKCPGVYYNTGKFNDEENNIINTHTIQQANSAQSISSMELLSNAVPFKSAPTPYTVRNIDTNAKCPGVYYNTGKFNDEENNIINTHTIQQANSAQSISSMELLSNAVPFKSAPTPYTVRNIDTNAKCPGVYYNTGKFNDEENNIINTHTIQQANSAQSISSMELLSNAVPFKSAPTPYTVRNIDTNTNAQCPGVYYNTGLTCYPVVCYRIGKDKVSSCVSSCEHCNNSAVNHPRSPVRPTPQHYNRDSELYNRAVNHPRRQPIRPLPVNGQQALLSHLSMDPNLQQRNSAFKRPDKLSRSFHVER